MPCYINGLYCFIGINFLTCLNDNIRLRSEEDVMQNNLDVF